MGSNSSYSVDRRRRAKAKLVKHHGGICVDCEERHPPFVMQFDHRDPSEKSFQVSSVGTRAFPRLLEESLKCDMVCGNCHAMRTHRQRCSGCEHCVEGWTGAPYGGVGVGEPKHCDCGKKIQKRSKRCLECFRREGNGVDWPSDELLLEEFKATSYTAIGLRLGVSTSAVWKRMKRRNLT